MIEIYILIGVVVLCIAAVWYITSISKARGADEQKIKYQEAEIALREKMADIDTAPDTDDPLSRL
jgi:hypothetical protein